MVTLLMKSKVLPNVVGKYVKQEVSMEVSDIRCKCGYRPTRKVIETKTGYITKLTCCCGNWFVGEEKADKNESIDSAIRDSIKVERFIYEY